ncbi:hypothetical protein HN014_18125 [Aquimarina sp. TRL1]|uniref:hypothetical protein n=1 Tax=Aquimarina sp. (strain TRL1) TaxID=2736252 RepID=UPI00158DCE2D|nr:hypothetical protein [Aquimarina sp. TRL1]QKX06753.1 hypothetical protein HN014_18125 [Aquimarina sp. TRL1]
MVKLVLTLITFLFFCLSTIFGQTTKGIVSIHITIAQKTDKICGNSGRFQKDLHKHLYVTKQQQSAFQKTQEYLLTLGSKISKNIDTSGIIEILTGTTNGHGRILDYFQKQASGVYYFLGGVHYVTSLLYKQIVIR